MCYNFAMIRIAHENDVAQGECITVEAGGKELALCHVGDQFYAIDNYCPHQGGPLAQGFLDGTSLVCPLHAWTFDVTNGEMPGNPIMKVGCFRVVVEGEDVLVEI